MAYVIAEPYIGVKDTACVGAIHPKKDPPVLKRTVKSTSILRCAPIVGMSARVPGLHGLRPRRCSRRVHGEVEEIVERSLRQNHLARKETIQLRELLVSLCDLHRAHLAIEKQEVFSLAQNVLSASQMMVIGRRMASRRGISFLAEWAYSIGPEKKDEE